MITANICITLYQLVSETILLKKERLGLMERNDLQFLKRNSKPRVYKWTFVEAIMLIGLLDRF